MKKKLCYLKAGTADIDPTALQARSLDTVQYLLHFDPVVERRRHTVAGADRAGPFPKEQNCRLNQRMIELSIIDDQAVRNRQFGKRLTPARAE